MNVNHSHRNSTKPVQVNIPLEFVKSVEAPDFWPEGFDAGDGYPRTGASRSRQLLKFRRFTYGVHGHTRCLLINILYMLSLTCILFFKCKLCKMPNLIYNVYAYSSKQGKECHLSK